MFIKRPLGIIIVAILMIIFGVAEVATGVGHNFLGILSISGVALSTYAAAFIGTVYALGGLCLLVMKKHAGTIALICLLIVICGRVFLVMVGLYPINTGLQTIAIIIGTILAIIFAIYIKINLNNLLCCD